MNNWFALTVAIMEMLAGALSLSQGRIYWFGIWMGYGIASLFLFLAEGK